MTVGKCKHCEETIMTPATQTYYVHTRTGMAQCGIRYATPINPTADETKDPDTWTRLDLDAFWEGLNGIEPIGAMSEPISNVTEEPLTSTILSKGSSSERISFDTKPTEERKFSELETQVEHSDISASAISDTLPESECDHLWLNKAGAGYRENPVEVCAKCGEEL